MEAPLSMEVPVTTLYELATQSGSAKATASRAPRACEACRTFKVRCLFDHTSGLEKCKRCARTNQDCIVRARGPRKPRKRTDTRIGELEKQVEFLRTMIEQSNTQPTDETHGVTSNDYARKRVSTSSESYQNTSFDSLVTAQAGETGLMYHYEHTSPQETVSIKAYPTLCPPLRVRTAASVLPYTIIDETSSPATVPFSKDARSSQADSAVSTRLFNRFNANFAQHFPLPLFDDTETAGLAQKNKPTLFLAIISAASGAAEPELHVALNEELAQEFAKRIIVNAEKSIELIQALIVAAVFYSPPDTHEKLKYYQYIHLAGTMASDIGFARPIPVKSAGSATFHHGSLRVGSDSDQNEGYRTLIASYMNCLSVARSMRRPSMLPFDSTINECAEALEASPNAMPRDRELIAWFKLECLMEEATNLLGLVDRGATFDLADVRNQRLIKLFEQRLSEWKKALFPGDLSPSLEITYHYSNMFLHEIAFHTNENLDDFRPPFRLATPRYESHALAELIPAKLESIAASASSACSLIMVFLGLAPECLRAFPTVLFVRVSYAVFILMKTHFINNSPGSPLTNIMPFDRTTFDEHLDRLVSHLHDAANEGKCRVAVKFHTIFTRCRNWFRKHAPDAASTHDADELFEPLRMLSINDDNRVSQKLGGFTAPSQNCYDTTSLVEHPGTLCHAANPNTNLESLYRPSELIRPDWSATRGAAKPWTLSTAMDGQTPSILPAQANKKPEQFSYGSIGVDPPAFLPGCEDDTMADSLNFDIGFDFEMQLWDLEMGDMVFER